jgi:ribonuclease I
MPYVITHMLLNYQYTKHGTCCIAKLNISPNFVTLREFHFFLIA